MNLVATEAPDIATLSPLTTGSDPSPFYTPQGPESPLLPKSEGDTVRIPMSNLAPYDLADNAQDNPATVTNRWRQAIERAHRRGEVLVINVCSHAESPLLASAESTLARAKLRGDIWIASAGQITEWWQLRNRARVGVHDLGDGLWHVAVSGPLQLVTACRGTTVVGPRSMVTSSSKRPVVYCGWPRSQAVSRALRDNGFVVETRTEIQETCALDPNATLGSGSTPAEVIRFAYQRKDELIRLMPWPAGYTSCLCVTAGNNLRDDGNLPAELERL